MHLAVPPLHRRGLRQQLRRQLSRTIPRLVPRLGCSVRRPSSQPWFGKVDQKTQRRPTAPWSRSPSTSHTGRQVAAEKYPNGLPKPHSDDPTQWLFNGHPKGSEQPLQVAVARLLGYRWPRQTGSSFPDCPALGSDDLEVLRRRRWHRLHLCDSRVKMRRPTACADCLLRRTVRAGTRPSSTRS